MNLQQQIADVLELEFKFRNNVARQISYIQDHRVRVIADIVTGQVDVRGIEVPEVAEEELLALDQDAGESDDITSDDLETEVEE